MGVASIGLRDEPRLNGQMASEGEQRRPDGISTTTSRGARDATRAAHREPAESSCTHRDPLSGW